MRYTFSDIGFLIIGIASLRGFLLMSKEVSFKKFLLNQSTNPIFSLVLVVIIYVFQTLLASSYNATWFTPIVPMIWILIIMEIQMLSSWISKERFFFNFSDFVGYIFSSSFRT